MQLALQFSNFMFGLDLMSRLTSLLLQVATNALFIFLKEIQLVHVRPHLLDRNIFKIFQVAP